jgi:hypothetical protein
MVTIQPPKDNGIIVNDEDDDLYAPSSALSPNLLPRPSNLPVNKLFTHQHTGLHRASRPSSVITKAIRGGSNLPVLTANKRSLISALSSSGPPIGTLHTGQHFTGYEPLPTIKEISGGRHSGGSERQSKSGPGTAVGSADDRNVKGGKMSEQPRQSRPSTSDGRLERLPTVEHERIQTILTVPQKPAQQLRDVVRDAIRNVAKTEDLDEDDEEVLLDTINDVIRKLEDDGSFYNDAERKENPAPVGQPLTSSIALSEPATGNPLAIIKLVTRPSAKSIRSDSASSTRSETRQSRPGSSTANRPPWRPPGKATGPASPWLLSPWPSSPSNDAPVRQPLKYPAVERLAGIALPQASDRGIAIPESYEVSDDHFIASPTWIDTFVHPGSYRPQRHGFYVAEDLESTRRRAPTSNPFGPDINISSGESISLGTQKEAVTEESRSHSAHPKTNRLKRMKRQYFSGNVSSSSHELDNWGSMQSNPEIDVKEETESSARPSTVSTGTIATQRYSEPTVLWRRGRIASKSEDIGIKMSRGRNSRAPAEAQLDATIAMSPASKASLSSVAMSKTLPLRFADTITGLFPRDASFKRAHIQNLFDEDESETQVVTRSQDEGELVDVKTTINTTQITTEHVREAQEAECTIVSDGLGTLSPPDKPKVPGNVVLGSSLLHTKPEDSIAQDVADAIEALTQKPKEEETVDVEPIGSPSVMKPDSPRVLVTARISSESEDGVEVPHQASQSNLQAQLYDEYKEPVIENGVLLEVQEDWSDGYGEEQWINGDYFHNGIPYSMDGFPNGSPVGEYRMTLEPRLMNPDLSPTTPGDSHETFDHEADPHKSLEGDSGGWLEFNNGGGQSNLSAVVNLLGDIPDNINDWHPKYGSQEFEVWDTPSISSASILPPQLSLGIRSDHISREGSSLAENISEDIISGQETGTFQPVPSDVQLTGQSQHRSTTVIQRQEAIPNPLKAMLGDLKPRRDSLAFHYDPTLAYSVVQNSMTLPAVENSEGHEHPMQILSQLRHVADEYEISATVDNKSPKVLGRASIKTAHWKDDYSVNQAENLEPTAAAQDVWASPLGTSENRMSPMQFQEPSLTSQIKEESILSSHSVPSVAPLRSSRPASTASTTSSVHKAAILRAVHGSTDRMRSQLHEQEKLIKEQDVHIQDLQARLDEQTAMFVIYQAAQADLLLEILRDAYWQASGTRDLVSMAHIQDKWETTIQTMWTAQDLIKPIVMANRENRAAWITDCVLLSHYYRGVAEALTGEYEKADTWFECCIEWGLSEELVENEEIREILEQGVGRWAESRQLKQQPRQKGNPHRKYERIEKGPFQGAYRLS